MAASAWASSRLTPCSRATATKRPWKLGQGASSVSPASRNTHSSGRGVAVGLLMARRLSARRAALLREPVLELLPDVVDLPAEVLERTGVVDHQVRAGEPLVGGELRDDAGLRPPGRHAR